MANGSIVLSPTLGIVLVVLVALGTLVLWLGKLGPEQAVVSAALRAAVQLAAV